MQQLSVSSLLRYLKNRLDNDDNLQKVYVSGEISDFTHHFSGHLYFTLKDENAAIACVMFKSAAALLNFEPKTGDKVILYANTSIYEASGKLQLYVLKMNLDGMGQLYRQYELLKEKLEKQGKFALEHKKQLKKYYLDNVAVLVGDNSAAMSDIKKAFNRRWPLCNVDYYPVLVQGNGAAESIINTLKQVDEKSYDAIILSRGGGSFEDLFCFNDEELINTIYDLKTFIVTGIGHEQDFTLADFVSDLRAATPTAAVEIITPDIDDVIDTVDNIIDQMVFNVNNKLNNYSMKFDYILEKLINYRNHFTNLSLKIDNDVNNIKLNLLHNISKYINDIDNMLNSANFKLNFALNNAQLQYKRFNTLLQAYSSTNVLKRGYTLVVQDNKVIKNKKDIKNKEFEIRFNDGSIVAKEIQ